MDKITGRIVVVCVVAVALYVSVGKADPTPTVTPANQTKTYADGATAILYANCYTEDTCAKVTTPTGTATIVSNGFELIRDGYLHYVIFGVTVTTTDNGTTTTTKLIFKDKGVGRDVTLDHGKIVITLHPATNADGKKFINPEWPS